MLDHLAILDRLHVISDCKIKKFLDCNFYSIIRDAVLKNYHDGDGWVSILVASGPVASVLADSRLLG